MSFLLKWVNMVVLLELLRFDKTYYQLKLVHPI